MCFDVQGVCMFKENSHVGTYFFHIQYLHPYMMYIQSFIQADCIHEHTIKSIWFTFSLDLCAVCTTKINTNHNSFGTNELQ